MIDITNTNKITQLHPGSYLYHHGTNTEFELVSGKKITNLQLAFETYGKLNHQKDNIILIHHSLSMSAHVTDLYKTGVLGWWENMVGPNLPIDTNKYFIICINNIGSCFGSSGPNNCPNFPQVTIHDIVRSQKLLLDYLGISKLKLVIGSSIGGMLSLTWLQSYPKTIESLFVAACSAKAYAVNIYNRMMQQEIISSLKHSDPKLGLKLARMLGYYYYRSQEEFNNRFSCNNFNISDTYANLGLYKNTELYNYFDYNAKKFVEIFDLDSYLCLLNALDLYDLTIDKDYHLAGFFDAYQQNKDINITIAGIDSDLLFPLYQQHDLNTLLKQAGYKTYFIEHHSTHGHDAFLTEYLPFGKYIQKIL
jgi:homoserine O-acetyltransferase